MVSSPLQSHLSLMDVFAAVLPGAVVLAGIALLVVQVGHRLPDVGITGLALGVALSFVTGMVLQTVGRAITDVMSRVEKRLGLPNVTPPTLKSELKRRHAAEEKTWLEERFWCLCKDRLGFSVDKGSAKGDDDQRALKEYDFLWRALLTYLESTAYSQTVRMQALSAMTRGFWTGFGLLTLVYLAPLVLRVSVATSFRHPALGYEVVGAGLLTVVFWGLNKTFKKLWLKNMMIEFALDQTMRQASSSEGARWVSADEPDIGDSV